MCRTRCGTGIDYHIRRIQVDAVRQRKVDNAELTAEVYGRFFARLLVRTRAGTTSSRQYREPTDFNGSWRQH